MKTLKTRVTTFATALIIAATGISTTAITAYAATSYSHNYKTVEDDTLKLKSVRKGTYYKGSSDDYMIATNSVKPTDNKNRYSYSEVQWWYKNIYGTWKKDTDKQAHKRKEGYAKPDKALKAEATTTSWFERDSKWTNYFDPKFNFGKATKK